MEQKILIFGKQCIDKTGFHKDKRPISIDKVDIDKIVIFSKDSYGRRGSFKYFIGYITNYADPLSIKLPQMNGYAKYFDRKNKYINLLLHDKELLKEIQYNMG